jgi:hypothetical protein
MYALHDLGLAVSALPPPSPTVGPTDQLERRAVEATERGSLQTEERFAALYNSTSAVLQLVESSAKGFSEMLEAAGDGGIMVAPAGSEGTESSEFAAGRQVDVYA